MNLIMHSVGIISFLCKTFIPTETLEVEIDHLILWYSKFMEILDDFCVLDLILKKIWIMLLFIYHWSVTTGNKAVLLNYN